VRGDDLRDGVDDGRVGGAHPPVMDDHPQARQHVVVVHPVEQARAPRQPRLEPLLLLRGNRVGPHDHQRDHPHPGNRLRALDEEAQVAGEGAAQRDHAQRLVGGNVRQPRRGIALRRRDHPAHKLGLRQHRLALVPVRIEIADVQTRTLYAGCGAVAEIGPGHAKPGTQPLDARRRLAPQLALDVEHLVLVHWRPGRPPANHQRGTGHLGGQRCRRQERVGDDDSGRTGALGQVVQRSRALGNQVFAQPGIQRAAVAQRYHVLVDEVGRRGQRWRGPPPTTVSDGGEGHPRPLDQRPDARLGDPPHIVPGTAQRLGRLEQTAPVQVTGQRGRGKPDAGHRHLAPDNKRPGARNPAIRLTIRALICYNLLPSATPRFIGELVATQRRHLERKARSAG